MRDSKFKSDFLLAGLIVFLSGASTLTYEIVWQRQMFHLFGASAPAIAAILTAIFLGIAVGSRLSHRTMKLVRRPVVLLALLEAAIGIWGILVPRMMWFAGQLYVATAHLLGEESQGLLVARFVFAIVPLLPATLCMGATIPVMVRAFGQGATPAVAWVYGLNVLGAVAGAATTGLVWIRILGQAETAWVAISLNAVVAVLLIVNKGRLESGEDVTSSSGKSDESVAECNIADRNMGERRTRLKAIYFAAGFVALGLEVVWLRYLGIVNSNSTVTFSLTLVFYLAGMGLGSLLLYPVLRKFTSAYAALALANGGVAMISLATFQVIYAAASLNLKGIVIPAMAGNLTLSSLYLTEATSTFLLLFFPAVSMGMVYPAICDSASESSKSSNWVGDAYFVGTMGSVAGILLVSLFVIPAVGLHATFSALVIVSAFLCILSVRMLQNVRAQWVSYALMGVSMILAIYISWDPRPVLRNTVARKIEGKWMESTVDGPQIPSAEIVRFKAGASGTVITKRETKSDDFLVYVDDQLVASTNLGAKVDALMLAHLPLLLHPAPANELTVGFGTGGTSHAITTHGIEAYCVEIEPEVPRSAHLLTKQNYGVLENPLFNLILNDARDHLKVTQRRYDVIATDVTNLQYKQNSSLYTVEYFELMKRRLNPDGVACAWIPMAAIATEELKILMKSFQHVFPHATLWYMNHTHTNFGILIATPEPLKIDYQRFTEGFLNPSIAASLNEIGLSEPMQLVNCLHLDEDGYRSFCGDVVLHTDNHPTLEFSSPLSFYQYDETFCENLASELRYRPQDFRNYVKNGPDADDEIWQQHRKASLAGCKVILCMYQFRTLWARGEQTQAIELLNLAIRTAEAGLEAWPEDTVREEFYIRFFDAAQSQLNGQFR